MHARITQHWKTDQKLKSIYHSAERGCGQSRCAALLAKDWKYIHITGLRIDINIVFELTCMQATASCCSSSQKTFYAPTCVDQMWKEKSEWPAYYLDQRARRQHRRPALLAKDLKTRDIFDSAVSQSFSVFASGKHMRHGSAYLSDYWNVAQTLPCFEIFRL